MSPKRAGAFSVAHVTSITEINNSTVWLSLDMQLEAVAGQFVMVWLPGIGEKPFSIAAIDPFGLLVVDVGPCSHAIHQLTPGDPLWIKGPLGQGFSLAGDHVLLVGGGYGSAPLLPLAQDARNQTKHVSVCLGAQSKQGLLLIDRFADLGCFVECSTDDGSEGTKGLVTTIVERKIQQARVDTLYACGPTGMLSALAKLCKSYQIDYQLSWEAHMRCGMGLCGSCEVPANADPELPDGWLACFDGPVFKREWH